MAGYGENNFIWYYRASSRKSILTVTFLSTAFLLAGCGASEAEPAATPVISVVPATVSAVATVVANAVSSILPTPPTATYWIECAKENGTCTLPIVGTTRVRYGEDGKYAYRDVANTIACSSGAFGGDPAPNVVKSCAYASATLTAPIPVVNGKPTAARDRLGINVASLAFFSGEQTFANQAAILEWRDPNNGWSYVAADRLRDGTPASIEPGHGVLAFLAPPASAWRGQAPETRCTWAGTGSVGISGASLTGTGSRSITFRWPRTTTPVQTVSVTINASDAADPVRAIDCREPGETGTFAAQFLNYLKPFGVLRFLDWSAANNGPANVTWAARARNGVNAVSGSDGTALEYQIDLANAVNASPWFTIPWNADADYHRRMAQLVHDSVPAGKPVYVEVSNEVWNYQFSQARQAEKEGLERKLSDNGFGANLARYAQKITEVMPIWAEVFKDRPRDLVRVAATQGENPWVGQQILEWNNSAVVPYIDAVAIAPYFHVDPIRMTGSHASNMALVAAEAKKQIAVSAMAYKAMVSRYGKRLIAYEGGQHQIDVDNQARLEAINRDPAMQAIYRQYLTDWNALTGDLFALYSATGPISRFGAWGLREYAGQPISETPKLRGVMDYTNQ